VISVVLVDDHAVVRSGIRLLLDKQEDIEVIGEAGNAKDALFRARALKPDVILLDVVMPGESGIEVLPKLLKEAADEEVVSAVREIAQGGRYVHPTLGARMVAADAEERAAAEADPLSEREREVLRLLALGHTNQEIAEQLYISVRTAESHRAHIMQKLRLATRAELVRYALSHGLLAEDSS
jgi:two-component system response regulator NreC